MDIVLVSTFKQHCGIATYTEDLANALVAKGHQVTVLAEALPLTHNRETHTDPVKFHRIWDRSSFNAEMFCRQILGGNKRPDVVHFQHEFGLFQNSYEFVKATRLLTKNGIRVVVTLHTIVAPPERVGFFSNFNEDVSYVAHTPPALSLLHKWKIPLAYIIPHGCTIRIPTAQRIDESYKTLGFDPKPTVFCPGFVSKTKGHIEILNAFASTYFSMDGNARLIIIGECRDALYQVEIYNEIARLGLEEAVIFESTFKSSLHDYFMISSAVILGAGKTTPYSASGQMHTAMGYGAPVVAKNVPIYHGSEGALYYNDKYEASTLLTALLENTYLYKESVRRQFRTAGDRSWDRVADMHLELYANKK